MAGGCEPRAAGHATTVSAAVAPRQPRRRCCGGSWWYTGQGRPDVGCGRLGWRSGCPGWRSGSCRHWECGAWRRGASLPCNVSHPPAVPSPLTPTPPPWRSAAGAGSWQRSEPLLITSSRRAHRRLREAAGVGVLVVLTGGGSRSMTDGFLLLSSPDAHRRPRRHHPPRRRHGDQWPRQGSGGGVHWGHCRCATADGACCA